MKIGVKFFEDYATLLPKRYCCIYEVLLIAVYNLSEPGKITRNVDEGYLKKLQDDRNLLNT